MPDKIHLLLETILQESRAAREDIVNIKKEMVTHEVFQSHIDSMTTKLNSISNEQNQQKTKIDSLNSKFSKKDSKIKNLAISQKNKIGGVIFVIIFTIIGFFASHVVVKQAPITSTTINANIISGQK